VKYIIALLALCQSLSAANVTLAWDASPDPGIGEYFVHYGTSSGVYVTTNSAGTNLTKVITGLVPGLTYYFAATARNTNGLESGYSNEIFYRVPTQNFPPTISIINDQTVTLPLIVNFTIVDPEGSNVVVNASSANQTLIPDKNLYLTNTASSNWVLWMYPVYGQIGIADISILADDGAGPTISTFKVTIIAPRSPFNLRISEPVPAFRVR